MTEVDPLVKNLFIISSTYTPTKIGIDIDGNLYQSANGMSRWYYEQDRVKTIKRLKEISLNVLDSKKIIRPAKCPNILTWCVNCLTTMRDYTYLGDVWVYKELSQIIENFMIARNRQELIPNDSGLQEMFTPAESIDTETVSFAEPIVKINRIVGTSVRRNK